MGGESPANQTLECSDFSPPSQAQFSTKHVYSSRRLNVSVSEVPRETLWKTVLAAKAKLGS